MTPASAACSISPARLQSCQNGQTGDADPGMRWRCRMRSLADLSMPHTTPVLLSRVAASETVLSYLSLSVSLPRIAHLPTASSREAIAALIYYCTALRLGRRQRCAGMTDSKSGSLGKNVRDERDVNCCWHALEKEIQGFIPAITRSTAANRSSPCQLTVPAFQASTRVDVVTPFACWQPTPP